MLIESRFSNIRSSILEILEKAQDEILVAVYWFTNHELFEKLLQKLSDKKKVCLVIHNDYVNNRTGGLDLQKFVDCGGQLHFSYLEHPMHNKFCIVDNHILITGSYNWTYYAEIKNDENILIIQDNPDVTSAFRKEFFRIKEALLPIGIVEPISIYEINENSSLNIKDYLVNDIIFQAKETSRQDLINSALLLAPENIEAQVNALKLKLIKVRRLKFSIGIDVHYGTYIPVFEKETIIPCIATKELFTIRDDQSSLTVNLYYGEQKKASKNTLLSKLANMGYGSKSNLLIKELPLKPAGLAKVKMNFSISVDGILDVGIRSVDNGSSDCYSCNLIEILEEC